MAIISSPRWRAGDREAWDALAAQDLVYAQTRTFARRVEEAEIAVVRFARAPCYASVSWGKDSTVLAHLVATLAPHVPLAWIREEPICSPEALLVRDAFLAAHPSARYEEVTIHCRIDDAGQAHASGIFEVGLAEIRRRLGVDRYLFGIRAGEAAGRSRYLRRSGTSTERSCAPLIRWTDADVFAHLAAHDLPVHPAYAMSFGGVWPRERLRVSSIGCQHGRGCGRDEWEQGYYPDVRSLHA